MKITLLTLSIVAFLFTFSTQTFAATFTVNQAGDAGDFTCDATCTLRDAIDDANNAITDDTISFDAGLTTITLTNEIVIENAGTLTINGNGANVLTIDGGPGTNRIFYTNGATATITDVTLTGGGGTGTVGNGRGGAILAEGGSLTLDRVHVTANTASGGGGGGVYYRLAGTHQISNSTFSSNIAALSCGGIRIDTATLTAVNTTISGNSVTATSFGAVGGGICNIGATTTLRNVTITNNTAGSGGGIFQGFGNRILNIGNTIVAGNTATVNSPEIRFDEGVLTSAGHNLIGGNAGDSTNTVNPIAYQSTDIRDVNPRLGPVQNNGGTTPTHALLFGSPAIDAGNNCVFLASCPSGVPSFALLTDQRGAGFTRSADGNGDTIQVVDIGAFEAQTAPVGPTAAAVGVGGRVATADGRGIPNVRVTITDSNGATQTVLSDEFGNYSFDDVQAGETYIFSVSHKRYSFNQSTQVHSITEETNQVNFVGLPTKIKRRF